MKYLCNQAFKKYSYVVVFQVVVILKTFIIYKIIKIESFSLKSLSQIFLEPNLCYINLQ